MGGVVAWRERQAEMAEAARAWDEPTKDEFEEVYDENGDLVEVERGEREERYEEEWEYDVEAKKEDESKDECREDDVSLVMGTLLCLEQANNEAEFHYGYDAQDAEHRS